MNSTTCSSGREVEEYTHHSPIDNSRIYTRSAEPLATHSEIFDVKLTVHRHFSIRDSPVFATRNHETWYPQTRTTSIDACSPSGKANSVLLCSQDLQRKEPVLSIIFWIKDFTSDEPHDFIKFKIPNSSRFQKNYRSSKHPRRERSRCNWPGRIISQPMRYLHLVSSSASWKHTD